MKLSKSIGLGVITLVVLSILYFYFGLFNRFNFITAYWDKWRGIERIIIYGEPFKNDVLKARLAPKFGFNYERHAGCNVIPPFVNGVKDYNKIMAKDIKDRLGDDWDKILDQEISKMK